MATTAPAGVRESGTAAAPAADSGIPKMSHRQILEALSGLVIGMFVAILSSTIVSNALPTIIRSLHGSQTSYTWVVTATLLATTATTPIWGKLADLFSKKLLIQLALIIYVAGSAVAGASQNTTMLITARVIQGVGVGGLSALAQTIMASMIAPRDRGRYSGYMGAAFALGTISGPLIGGAIVDSSLGWRWCFYVCVPVAVIAIVILQKTLKLPVVRKEGVKIDVLGATLITAAVCALLIWVSLAGTGAGKHWDWMSWQTGAFIGGAVVLILLFILTESKVKMPVVPLHMFRIRTVALASVGSLFIGVAMFAGTVYLSQYFQLARGKSPTMSGVSTLPMIAGLFLATTISGQIISRTGRWKGFLVAGALVATAGAATLSTIRFDTNYWIVAIWMFLLGAGIGMAMQNLVLSVQNQVRPHELGAASSLVTFFRTLGGAIGVSALGAVMSTKIGDYLADGLQKAHLMPPKGMGGGSIPDPKTLPHPLRGIIESAYGHGIADIFLYAAPFAFIAFIAVLCIKEVPLRTRSGGAGEPEQSPQAHIGDVPSPSPVGPQGGAAEHRAPVAVSAAAQNGGVAHRATHDDQFGNTQAVQSMAAASNGIGAGGPSVPSGPGIAGFVRRGDGSPLPRATLTLIDLGGRQLGRAATGADGGYLLGTPGGGSYVLIAAADGHQPQASTVVVGYEQLLHDVLLTGTSGLAGVVRSADGAGSPVAGATVVVTDQRGEVLATGRTGADGAFRFDELVAGSFTVAVSAAGHRPTAAPVEVSGNGTSSCEIRLRAGATLQGVVLAGPDERPLFDARVTLVDGAGNVVGATTTSPNGEYAFTDLDAGEYTVIASGYPPAATGVSVQDDGQQGFDLRLRHPED